ncbi:MAG: CRISPR-associated helicase Cas3' [Armatimonadetes bacterium]|nr:CRISPR-associated helicase Cas3' [Armatimonadota bacterium]
MLISHPAEKNAPEKPLKDHLRSVGEISRHQIQKMRLDLTIISQNQLAELSYLIGIFHDFGKSSTYFQKYIRGQRKGDVLTQHSFISAVVAYHMVRQKGFDPAWAVISYLLIKRHHGNLETLREDEQDNLYIASKQLENILTQQVEEIKALYSGIFDLAIIEQLEALEIEDFGTEIEEFEEFLDEFWDKYSGKNPKIELFFVVNLLFSVLIDNDKKDAARLDTEYFEGNLSEPVNDVFAYIEDCRRKEPEKFNPTLPLNRFRVNFLNEIVANPGIKPEKHFYTITAPTGIGKTFGCLAFANRLKKQLPKGEGRIIYCLPYTSIIDQNYDEFKKIIRFAKKKKYDERPERYLLKHHHLSFKSLKNRKEEEHYTYKDYLDDRLFVEAWESAFIVTTFVQFFHTIIGYTNSFLKKFHNMVNAIVILDEVQNIPPDYYHLLKQVLDVLGKRFNIYFLLITATQPEILDREKSEPISVVQSETYMKAPLFNRVKLTVQKKEQTLEEFGKDFCESFSDDNCLIVMNTKKSAISLYEQIREQKTDYQLYCLTTFLVPLDRVKKINKIKKALKDGEKIIVVSTQLIEAGVDLSFKLVYRDFGPLDSIVQVAGRCNRNNEYGELGGEMRLLKLVNANHGGHPYHTYVYNPILAQHVEQTLKQDIYEGKDFSRLSADYFEKFEFTHKAGQLLAAICDLNYDDDRRSQIPVNKFKLIEEYSEETLFVLVTSEAEQKMELLLAYKKQLQKKGLSKEEKEARLFEIERLEGALKSFQISLRKPDLEYYKDSPIIEENERYKFISYDNQVKYAYDQDIGFLTIPKTEVSTTVSF